MRRTDKPVLEEVSASPPSAAEPVKTLTEPLSPTHERLSRFSHQHVRHKPAPHGMLSEDQAKAIIAQISNDGVDTIPLSVLQDALPSRVTSRHGVDALPRMMAAPDPLRSRRHA